jgi:hypothetical protein
VGTISDLSRQNMKLQQRELLTLYSEDLEVDGVVQYSDEENIWVAVIDWNEIREVEDIIVSNSGLPESGLILPVS